MNTASKSGAINIWGLPTLHNNNTFASTDGGNGQSKQTNCAALMSLYGKLKTAYSTADTQSKKDECQKNMTLIMKQMQLENCAQNTASFNGGCGCGCGNTGKSNSFTGNCNEPMPTNSYYNVNTGAFIEPQPMNNAFTVPTINAFSNPNNQMPAVTNLPPAVLPACVPTAFGVSDYTMPNVPAVAPVTATVCAPAKKRPTFLQWLLNGMKA